MVCDAYPRKVCKKPALPTLTGTYRKDCIRLLIPTIEVEVYFTGYFCVIKLVVGLPKVLCFTSVSFQ